MNDSEVSTIRIGIGRQHSEDPLC